MAYSGNFSPINITKYMGNPKNITYRSLWEKYCFKWCDETKEVVEWSSEEIVIPYLYEADNEMHRYYVDLLIKLKDGRTILVEVKPYNQTQQPKFPGRKTRRYIEESLTYVKNRNKWDAAEAYAKHKGWEFQIWTEKTLIAMNIMPKSSQRLKSIKRIKPIKKLVINKNKRDK